MRQYCADKVTVVWAFSGPLTQGLAKGTFFQPVRDEATFSYHPDGLGNTHRVYHPGTSGTVTLLIDAESAQHQILMTLSNTDRITRVLRGPMVVTDRNTAEVSYFNNTALVTTPDVSKGVSATVIPWQFHFESSFVQPFGLGLTNIVGD